MYAIIRTGGKQAKVREGDVLDVELLKGEGEIELTPLLVVGEDGSVTSDRATLAEAKVVVEIVGPATGPKVEIFKYKNKTGYRNRQGHRQKYTRIRVARIEAPGAEPEKPEKAQKPEKAGKPEKAQKTEPAEKAGKAETADTAPEAGKPAKPATTEKPATAEKAGKPEKADTAPEAGEAAETDAVAADEDQEA